MPTSETSPDTTRNDDGELTTAAVGHQLVEAGPLRLSATNFVGVLLDDLVTTLLRQLAQVVKLGLGVLIQGRDPHVQGRALH